MSPRVSRSELLLIGAAVLALSFAAAMIGLYRYTESHLGYCCALLR